MINNNWIFGKNAGLDFSTSIPTPTQGNAIDTFEGCASISDRNGNLLFYTDGTSIWDSSNTLKTAGLLGDSSSTQSAIIVPDPGNSDQYYVLTADGSSNASPPFNHFNGILLNVVTWSFSTLSSLTTLPSTRGFSPAEKLTAVQHKNCKDFWVITIMQRGRDGSTTGSGVNNGAGIFRIFKIDSSGIQHHTDIPMNVDIHEAGYLKASTNLQTIAVANGENKNVLVYPFNNTTGLVDISGLELITTKEAVYGVEFSPDSKVLYYSTISPSDGTGKGYVYQVDLNLPSPLLVGTFDNKGGHYAIGALQIGIDNRIYIAKSGENSLGAIENPNVLGIGCTVTNDFITLADNAICRLGLPNILPNACQDHDCNCGCTGCNEDAAELNAELIERAKQKFNTVKSHEDCKEPFIDACEKTAINGQQSFEPCFYFHWGDGVNDQIEEHDTEIFYITVCNTFKDITYKGLRITKVTVMPNNAPLDKLQIVPDRLINLDCLAPCSCQTREFAIITRANDIAGNYSLEVEYCYEEITIHSSSSNGVVKFPITITED